MALTPQQLQTLKASILAEQNESFAAMRLANDEQGMAGWYNAPSSAIVWRTSVTKDEITQNGFDWTRLDNLSVGAARVWDGLFDNAARATNPSKSNVRAGIDAVWKGTTPDMNVRAAIYVHCKRAATRLEALFATGGKTDVAPGLLAVQEQATAQMISDALRP